MHPLGLARWPVLVVLAGGPPRGPPVTTAPDTTRRLARILAAAYLRLLAARKAASDGQNPTPDRQIPLDVARQNKAPLPPRRRARG
ncbi:MAG TPA: hypothetical protein VJQ57_09200 [Acidimicrobiia bacterium]|nr:hypothetical protein [Acidimicrobiia bacterium]